MAVIIEGSRNPTKAGTFLDSLKTGPESPAEGRLVKVLVIRWDETRAAYWVEYPGGSGQEVGPLYADSRTGNRPRTTIFVQVVRGQIIRAWS